MKMSKKLSTQLFVKIVVCSITLYLARSFSIFSRGKKIEKKKFPYFKIIRELICGQLENRVGKGLCQA